ncbi:hypothetical protein LINGRAPRIM_LOCUS2944 [Linum grandiflorum]
MWSLAMMKNKVISMSIRHKSPDSEPLSWIYFYMIRAFWALCLLGRIEQGMRHVLSNVGLIDFYYQNP